MHGSDQKPGARDGLFGRDFVGPASARSRQRSIAPVKEPVITR